MVGFSGRLAMVMRTLAFALAVLVGATGAFAQTPAPGTAAVEARRQTLFVAMLRDPSNLDLAFEYATLSTQLGDFEGAIATYERMLIFAPNLPRVQLELAVLYYRIGAEDMARQYLEAVDLSTAPPEVVARVNTFLARVELQERRTGFSGFIASGGRFQSNANAGPSSATVTVGGLPVVLDDDARERADFSLFALGNVHLSYDLQNQGDLLEADVAIYNSLFADLKRLNTNLVEATAGPSFTLERFNIPNARAGVYGIAGATALGNEGYATTLGGGFRMSGRVSNWLQIESRKEIRAINYQNTDDYPTARLQTGAEYRVLARAVAELHPRWLGTVAGEWRNVDARSGFKSFTEYAGNARLTHLFFGPEWGWLTTESPWQVYGAVGALYRGFDDPDPVIDPDEKEQNLALFLEAGLAAPFEHGVSGFVTGQLRNQTSTYDTRDFFNAGVTVGVSKRF